MISFLYAVGVYYKLRLCLVLQEEEWFISIRMSPLQAILHNLHTVDNKILALCNFTKSYDMCS